MTERMRLDEDKRVALGFQPTTLHGVWVWLRYWGPVAHWGRVLFCTQCPSCYQVRWRWEHHQQHKPVAS